MPQKRANLFDFIVTGVLAINDFNYVPGIPVNSFPAPAISFNDADQLVPLVICTCTNSGQFHYELVDSSGTATPYLAASPRYYNNMINNRA